MQDHIFKNVEINFPYVKINTIYKVTTKRPRFEKNHNFFVFSLLYFLFL